MEKLKPILTHKFWILFGLALVIPLVGWWMATSSLEAAIEAQRSGIEQKFTGVPSGQVPNLDWIDKAGKVNTQLEGRLDGALRLLWQEQQKLKTWPNDISDLMQPIKYREDPPGVAKTLYRESYWTQFDQIRQIVKPFDEYTGEGLVMLPEGTLPQPPYDLWERFNPTSDEMWNYQEDSWLVRDLLTAIAAVNANSGAKLITEASIREIVQLDLMGGDRSTLQQGAGGQEGDPNMMGGPGEAGGVGMPEAAQFGRRGGNDLMGRGGPASADFDPTEEFGSATVANAGGGPDDIGGGAPMPIDPAGGMPGEPGQAGPQVRRYVDDDPSLPYKTRGFYLKVVMDHEKLPDLLAALTEVDWPIEVVRVQQVALIDDAAQSGMGGGMDGNFNTGRRAPRRSAFGRGGPDMDAGVGGRFNSRRGANPNRPLNRGRNPMGFDAGGPQGVDDSGQKLYAAAMADPALAEVAIAGLMTIYLEPTLKDENGESVQQPAQPITERAPVTTQPADFDENQPADPAAADLAADPAAQPPAAASESAAPAAPATTNPPAETNPPADASPATGTNPPAASSESPPQQPPAAPANAPAANPPAAPADPGAANETPPAASGPADN